MDLIDGGNDKQKKELFRAIKKVVFLQIDQKHISLEKADEVLGFVQFYLRRLSGDFSNKDICLHLAEKFPELQMVLHMFEVKESELMNDRFSLFVGAVMESKGMEAADDIMNAIDSCSDVSAVVAVLKQIYPEESSFLTQ